MSILPYRARRGLKRLTVLLLVIVLAAILVGIFWFLWMERFVVYTRQNGAIFDMSLSPDLSMGQAAQPPKKPIDVSIYYNEGDNTISSSKEMFQLVGYYADTAALEESVTDVLAQVKTLPIGTPVMVDVKSPKGAFFYSSLISDTRDRDISATAMDELIAYLESAGMYAIARLPALRDFEYGLHHVPDGLPVEGGYLWADDDYCYWLNPLKQGTITYLIQIVTELKNLGFDEVVFDEFRFPDTDKIIFTSDKDEALASAAKTLVTACASETFTVSFVGQTPTFPLPQGRSRLYMVGVPAAQAAAMAAQTGLEDPSVNLVFLTENHDTRFDAYGVLRPVSSAH